VVWQGVATRGRRLIVGGLALLALGAPSAAAAPPPPGSAWHEEYIQAPDGTRLHADVLRPSNLASTARTPVILSIGPYFNHSGQVGPVGPVEDEDYTPVGDAGPSSRFFDFIGGARLMQRGYTYVMVDLRGFGGSSGCLDWLGPGEQSDIKTAVEWAASRSWSTGKVGMYGKSYDGVTGLAGIALKPKGLAAVVAGEPVYDMYRYLYTNRVRYPNSLLTPALYDAIAGTPGTTGDEIAYQQNSLDDTERPACPAQNWADQQNPNKGTPYWQQRDLIAKTKGATTPLFLTQGFIEDNTKPDGAFDLFNGLRGPKRAWFGMWDHVRGNDTDESGRLLMGRKGWFDEVMRFYDRYVKGLSVAADPPVVVESSDGRWRGESRWPPADARTVTAKLRPGTYLDNGINNGTKQDNPPNGDGIWTFSPPLASDAHLAGIPHATVSLTASLRDPNLVVNVYDLDAGGRAILVSRNAYLAPGTGTFDFDLYGNDWIFPKGHRVGLLVTSSNSEWWAHVPTLQQVAVSGGSVRLPFLTCRRTATIQGDPSVKLESYRANAPFDVPAATVTGATDPTFPRPAALKTC
jgi:predicted acyl esterase